MAAIGGEWYVSDGMGFTAAKDDVPMDYWRYVYSTQPDGRKFIVAKVWAGDDSDYEGTARLVAASPELLRELKHLLAEWEESIAYEPDYMHLGDAARAVIAKAEGGVK